MRRNGRCRASKYDLRRCGLFRSLFCDEATRLKRNDQAIRKQIKLVRQQIEEDIEQRKHLGES
jgi:hypothetical protein